MSKKTITFVVLCSIILGGTSGWVFSRYLIPKLNTISFLARHNLVPSSAPLVINTRQEIRVNEGSDSIAAIQTVKPWVVTVVTGTDPAHTQTLGSGLILTVDGLIATTKTVAGNGQNLNVVLNDGTVKPATVKTADPFSELVFLKIDANNLPTATFGASKDLKLGQRIIVLSGSLGQYQASDIVTYLSSEVRNVNTEQLYSSEGFNRIFGIDGVQGAHEGAVVLSLDSTVEGLFSKGSVITAEIIRGAMNSYFGSGKITRNYIGITYQYLPKSLSNLYKVSEGIILRKADAQHPAVLPNSPAAAAGLKEGDIITQVNGTQLTFDNAFEDMISQKQPGDSIALTVQRGAQQLTLNLSIQGK